MNRPTPTGSAKRQTGQGRRVASTRSTPSPSNRSNTQFNIDGFQDDDDMISLNTTVEGKINPPPNFTSSFKSPIQMMREERSQFLLRMESMLERVEEELIYESRPSDEMSRISNLMPKARSVKSRPSDEHSLPSEKSSITEKSRIMERPSNNKFLEELEEGENEEQSSSGTDNDDDSTNVIATLVAEKPGLLQENIKRPVPVFSCRPTHITVDMGAQSPAQTNITMDATMMNDTMISTSVMMQDSDEENLSIMTPILDRYRLDPDDNSIGVKVVPNERGMHQRQRLRTHPEESEQTATAEFYQDSDGFRSPKGLPRSVSARKAQQYRKTPYPNKVKERSFDDENNPNTPQLAFSPVSSTPSFDTTNTESSFSVPPLRPRSVGLSQAAGARSSSSRTQSLPTTSTRLPKTSIMTTAGHQQTYLIEKITMAEYDSAPRVVQMNVSRDEANTTIAILNDYLEICRQRKFSEQEGRRALSTVFESEQQSKSVLLSLCHWKRLMMYRQEDNTTMFAVNSFEQLE